MATLRPTEALKRALEAARFGKLLGPKRQCWGNGYHPNYLEFKKVGGTGVFVAHGATITALLKRRAIVLDPVGDVYTLTPYGLTVYNRNAW